MKTDELLADLIERTRQHLNAAQQYRALPLEVLNFKTDPESWSILECMEHLNRYGDFYIPEITKRIKASNSTPKNKFKPGLLGNYFAKSMLPKEKLNKMNTFKSMNPINSALDKNTLDKFIRQQEQMIDLLQKAKSVSLTKTITGISISKWIKLRLGDTFRVVIYHNYRHIVQANRVLAAYETHVPA